MLKKDYKSTSYFKISDEVDITQTGILSYLERSLPFGMYFLMYLFAFSTDPFSQE